MACELATQPVRSRCFRR